MWKVCKTSSDSLTKSDVLNLCDPIITSKIPTYIDEYFKKNPIPIDMGSFVRLYNPNYYVNVVEVSSGLYQDMAGMQYRTDGTAYTVNYPYKTLYVWDYIKLPDGTISQVNEAKTIAGSFTNVDYITGTSAATITSGLNVKLTIDSHTVVRPMTITAPNVTIVRQTTTAITISMTNVKTITYSASAAIPSIDVNELFYNTSATTITLNTNNTYDVPKMPSTVEHLTLNNAYSIPLLKDSAIKTIVCNVATPVVLAETFRNTTLSGLTNVVLYGGAPAYWTYNSNAYKYITSYTNIATIGDYAFYGCSYDTLTTISCLDLSSIGDHAFVNVKNVDVVNDGSSTVALTLESISHCEDCLFRFTGKYEATDVHNNNYIYMTRCWLIDGSTKFNTWSCNEDCYMAYVITDGTNTMSKLSAYNCKNCIIAYPNTVVFNKQVGVDCENCTFLMPNCQTYSYYYCAGGFTRCPGTTIITKGPLTGSMQEAANITFVILTDSDSVASWSAAGINCTSITSTINYPSPEQFHKEVNITSGNYVTGFCTLKTTADYTSGYGYFCHSCTLKDTSATWPDSWFKYSTVCQVLH